MSQQPKHFYEFGEFRIDITKRRLLRGGEIVSLTPKAFDLLLALTEQSGKTIEKDELMQKVWPDTAVEENNLTQNIYTLRKIFGEGRNEHRYIATVPGLGYRFVAEVRRVAFDDEVVTIKENTEARIIIAETIEEDEPYQPVAPALSLAPATPLLPAPPRARPVNKKYVWLVVALVILLAAAAIYTIILYRRTEPATPPFQQLTVNRITRTGTTTCAAISPDGKQVVYSVKEANRDSLWLRHIATGSTRQIMPPEEAGYLSFRFSHDGNYIYFVKRRQGEAENGLYKMAALGGIPTRLVTGMEAFTSLSPDDRQIAFTRETQTESMLMIANTDGSSERRLAERPITDNFKVPAWSPDGRMIACSTGNGEANDVENTLVGVSLEDGSQRPLTTQKWSWTRWVEWLPDGTGLLLTARELPHKPVHIWHISYPNGEARRITNDSKDYYSLSLTDDSRTIAAIQTELLSEIWLSSVDNSSDVKKITFGNGYYLDVCFSKDGRIIFSSSESGNMDIWRMNADGTGKQQLTSEESVDTHQVVSPDGRYIIFSSNRAGSFNIWRMESDGSNPVRLTAGKGEKFPHCSPDGRWVIYNSVASDDNLYSLWKIPIEGGQPVFLADRTYAAAISPDGLHIAYFARPTGDVSSSKIVVIPFAGGTPEKTFDLPPDVAVLYQVRWAADGKAILYAAVSRGVSNVWAQPLDGTPARLVTDLKFEGGLLFDLSPDGKRFVFVRRQWVPDLVLLTDAP